MPDLTDVLLITAVVCVALGAGLIYIPAGLITVGVLTGALVLAAERGR